MKKQFLGICLLFICTLSKAQYEFEPTGRNDAPTIGLQLGLVGGGITAMLNNRDDLNADQRLDPQMMNFSYAGGVECIYWFQKTIGFGGQVLYWKGGASYLGKDTLTKLTLKGKSDFTYLKVPLLFHFKSFNRYYPNRRLRFSAMFGPYIALLQEYSDNVELKNEKGETVANSTISADGYESGVGVKLIGKLNGKIYNPIDLGFVFGIGGEMRLWRRTTIALHLRADIGASNVENTKGLKIVYDNIPNQEFDFKPWAGTYAKYVAPNAFDLLKNFESNRPATKNFSVGAFLSIRKYLVP